MQTYANYYGTERKTEKMVETLAIHHGPCLGPRIPRRRGNSKFKSKSSLKDWVGRDESRSTFDL